MRKGNESIGRKKRIEVRKKLCVMFLCLVFGSVMMTACSNGTRVVFTTGLSKNEVFRIGDETCTVPELMVYLTNIQNQYESVYGTKVWQISLQDVTLAENVKEIVLARIAQLKTMYLLAQDRGVTLNEAESAKVEAAAREYFASLNATEIELMGIDETVIRQLYEEYALSQKVYEHIIQDVNPEISDDEARTITVQHIFWATHTADGAGNKVSVTASGKQELFEEATGVHAMAVSGEHDFVDLATRYSGDSEITYSFGKGERDSTYEETAFSLATGEISKVIETQDGYYIIKCINTFDREQTDLNKLKIVEKRRKEVFGQEYEDFVATLVRQLNTDLWENIELLHDEAVTTEDFFAVYEKYFPVK